MAVSAILVFGISASLLQAHRLKQCSADALQLHKFKMAVNSTD